MRRIGEEVQEDLGIGLNLLTRVEEMRKILLLQRVSFNDSVLATHLLFNDTQHAVMIFISACVLQPAECSSVLEKCNLCNYLNDTLDLRARLGN